MTLQSFISMRYLSWVVILMAPLSLTIFFFFQPDADPQLFDPAKHFSIVSGGALTSLLVGVPVTWGSLRPHNVRLLSIGLALIGGAVLYAIHGLSTPGFILQGSYETAALSEGLGLLWVATFLAMGSLELPKGARTWIERNQLAIVAGAAALLLAYGLLALLGHRAIEIVVPVDNRAFAWLLAASVLLLMAFTVHRTLKSYSISQVPVQGAWLAGIVLLMEAQTTLVLVPRWHLAWWLYHAYVLFSFLVIFQGVLLESLRGHSFARALRTIAVSDLMTNVRIGFQQTAIALAAAAEAKDRYTEEHLQRVAELAVRIGVELGVPNSFLRTLSHGALLHDIGKLHTPDGILLKPGKLTPEEAVVMKQHTVAGHRIIQQVSNFEREAVIIRHHHEWWDGSGYPDGLRGEEIPLGARIVAVADIYDALTTTRPYRAALSHEEAIGIVQQETGTHLDPVCVKAFLRLVDQWYKEELEHSLQDAA